MRQVFVFFGLIQRPTRVGTVWPRDLELSLALGATNNNFSHTHTLIIRNYYKLTFKYILLQRKPNYLHTEKERLGFFKEQICPDPKGGENCFGGVSTLGGVKYHPQL